MSVRSTRRFNARRLASATLFSCGHDPKMAHIMASRRAAGSYSEASRVRWGMAARIIKKLAGDVDLAMYASRRESAIRSGLDYVF